MPKQDMIYDFAGPSYGNDFTCNIQGTLVWIGLSISTFYSTSGLPLFYLCMIKYKMEESEIKKFIEPVIHTIIFLFSVPAPFLLWYNGRYHPTPLEPWCTAVAYPWHCLLHEDNPEECMLKGSLTPFAKRSREILVYFYCFSYFATISTLFVCMLNIMCTFYGGTAGHNIRRSFSDRVSSANPNRIESLRQKSDVHTRFMIRIAFAYIFASTITIGSTILHAGEGSLLQTAPYITQSRLLLQFIHALLIPLQGFFNVLIFSALKIYEYRQVHPGNSIKDAILKLLINREEQLYFISRMSLINDIEMMDDDNFEDEDAVFSYTDCDKTSEAYSKKLLKELEMISYGDANNSSPGQRTKVEEQSAKKSVPTSSKYGSWLSRVPSDLSYSISGRVSSEGINSVDNLVSSQGGGLPSNRSASSQGGGPPSNGSVPSQGGGLQSNETFLLKRRSAK
jgi:hypothetical protein